MAKRDPVSEVLEVRSRSGSRSVLIDSLTMLWRARPSFQFVLASEAGPSAAPSQPRTTPVRDFFPIRLVTLLEVFTRRWLEKLIDHGAPYLANAAALVQSGTKFDFATAMAIQGKKVSIGQLVAHGVSINSIQPLAGCVTTVIGADLFDAVEHTYDRFQVERAGAPKAAIIADLPKTKASLARLFAVRHILVHEMPKTSPYSDDDIDTFLAAASEFTRATDQTLFSLLEPDYPLTTLDMNRVAGKKYAEAKSRLDDVLSHLAPIFKERNNQPLFDRAQAAWEAYSELQAQLLASNVEGGSLQPVVHVGEVTRLVKARAEQLRWWLDREEGDVGL